MALFPNATDESLQFLIAQRLEFRNLDNPDFLYAHQEFVRRFMSPYTPYRSIILFHDLGSGKSIACIATAVDHYLHDRKECIIVTKGQSGAESFMAQIMKFKDMSSTKDRWNESIFKMRRYIKLSNQITDMSDSEVAQTYSNKIIVLDEVHNIRFPGNNDMSECVYRSIMRIMQHCHNTKVMMATATPMTDNASQLEPLLQLCNYFEYKNFNNINMNGIISYNPYVLDKPVTHYMSNRTSLVSPSGEKREDSEGLYASNMTGHQKKHYEEHFAMGVPNDIYRSWTHLSLFCTPDGKYGKIITDSFMEKRNCSAQITPMSSKVTKEISYITYSPKSELRSMLCGDSLRDCSCKYSELLKLLESTEGNVFVFVEEVKGSGIILLSAILEANGYEMYIGENLEQELQPNPKRFTMCVGSPEICPNIQDRLEGFNSPLNKDGKYVRVLLGSKVIGESITLMNVRHFHCITPHWNNSTINQAVGRVVRNGSHNALDPNERTVNIYMHTAVPENLEDSIDVIKLRTCQEKQKSIQMQEDRMKEIAVDKYCIVNHDDAPKVTEFKVFCAVYIRHHIDTVLSALQMAFLLPNGDKQKDRYPSAPDVCYDIASLSNELDINIEILSQVLCIIIRENMALRVSFAERRLAKRPKNSTRRVKGGRLNFSCKEMYLRAHNNTVFLVDDCSLPYVMFQPRQTPTVVAEAKPNTHELSVEEFRHLPVKNKILYLENEISTFMLSSLSSSLESIELPRCKFLSTLFAVIDGTPCHLLWYRDIESAYTTSKAVPRKPRGKARIFVSNKGWEYVDADKEQYYLDKYKELYNIFLCKLSNQEIYGIISTIDGKMRIRQRDDGPIKDNRHIKRGKNISSLKLYELESLIETHLPCELGIYSKQYLRIDMIRKIEQFLIESELYCIL